MSDLISRQAAILQLSHNKCGNDENDIAVQHDIETIRALPSAQPEITLESAIDYLHEIGWMQEHDRILTESAQPEVTHEAVKDYCYKRCLTILTNECFYKLTSSQPEIIRCKDCKHGSPNGVYGCRLERYNFNDESVRMYGEDYCSYAERRIDEIN